MKTIKNLNIADLSFFEDMLKCLPSNIFFKDTECKYVFCTHYWRHVDTNNEQDWSIKGKTDLEIRFDKENAKKALEEDKKVLETGVGTKYRIKIDQDGYVEYFEIIKEPYIVNGKIIGIVGLINDVTKQVIQEQKLELYAETDELTGLNNRKYLVSWINEENNPSLYPLSIISADCNGLKQINDTYGHLVGDEFIRASAALLKIGMPSNSKIIRMGGDEFTIIMPNTNLQTANNYIEEVNKLSKDYKVHGQEVSIALGTYEIPEYTTDLDYYFSKADANMYKEKNKIYQLKKD